MIELICSPRHAFGDSEQDTSSPAIFLGISDMLEKFHEFIDPILRDGTLWTHSYHPPELFGIGISYSILLQGDFV